MRQGEACRLGRGDVDLNAETVTIADSKFGKSRMVFLHPTAAAALRAYDRARDEAFPEPAADTFLVNSRGGPLDSRNTSKTFAVLVTAAGIRPRPGSGPRDCTTCGTCSRSRRSWTGIATAATSRPASRSCPPG